MIFHINCCARPSEIKFTALKTHENFCPLPEIRSVKHACHLKSMANHNDIGTGGARHSVRAAASRTVSRARGGQRTARPTVSRVASLCQFWFELPYHALPLFVSRLTVAVSILGALTLNAAWAGN